MQWNISPQVLFYCFNYPLSEKEIRRNRSIDGTLYPVYVIVGPIGFVFGTHWLGTKGYYDRAKKGGNS